MESEEIELKTSRSPGYMSDSDAKRSNNDRLKGSNSKVLPRKDMKRRDSMPDLRSAENTRSFLYAEPSSMLQARTGVDLASQS